ncbi:IS1 family transposase [Snuella lapsa]|uniref:IS1 family transposase n=1 Tax=Snuella lapsa TaxID=870481 RepID=UPI0031F13E80
MECRRCQGKCNKNGCQVDGVQRYYCRNCKLSQQKTYTYKAYRASTNRKIHTLLINSCGINDISRILQISRHTVRKRLLQMARSLKPLKTHASYQNYEMDEMHVKVLGMGDYCYLSYAINRNTKEVIHFCIGSRTSKQLYEIVHKVLLMSPKYIYTDKWLPYKSIIPSQMHRFGKIFTNRIERYHLNLRTHLKCLSRKTICYPKSIKTLEAMVSLYFWGHTLDLKTL